MDPPVTLAPMPTWMTIAAPTRIELPRIKGSRFIAEARRIRSDDERTAFIDEVRAEHPGATHIV